MARLTLTSGTTEHSAETDAGGVYSFQSVVPETWTLELQLPSGWILDQGQTGNRIVSVRPNLTAHEDFTLVREPF